MLCGSCRSGQAWSILSAYSFWYILMIFRCSILIRLISQKAYLCQFLNRYHSAYLLIGSALRLSLSLGLNFNIHTNQPLHPVEREHYVRIWWSIYILDRFWGSKSGFPVQIHDDDIHVDLPSSLLSETHKEEFSDSAYQVAAVALAKITGNTTREIYSRKKYTESFLQREQKLLIQLEHWVRSLPESIRLHADKANVKDTLLLHLQFNYVSLENPNRPTLSLTQAVCNFGNSPCTSQSTHRPYKKSAQSFYWGGYSDFGCLV